jgi:hypothetical protein
MLNFQNKNLSEFADLNDVLKMLPLDERALQVKKNQFSYVGRKEHEKMFERWVESRILHFLWHLVSCLLVGWSASRLLAIHFAAIHAKRSMILPIRDGYEKATLKGRT